MIKPLVQIQAEVGEWSRRNFPGNLPHSPLLGIVEEVGELHTAFLIADEDERADKVLDAVGDILIYSADYCERNGFSLEELISGMPVPNLLEAELSQYIFELGLLCHSHLKLEQGIRGTPEQHRWNISLALAHLFAMIATETTDSLHSILDRVWTEVSKRDWTTNAQDGSCPVQ